MSILIQWRDFTLLGTFDVLTNLVAISLASKMLHQVAVNAPPIILKMETTCWIKFISNDFVKLHFHWWEENFAKKVRLTILYVKLNIDSQGQWQRKN